MNKKILLTLLFCFGFMFFGFGQDLKTYQIYNHKGNRNNFSKMIKKLNDYDVVLFGEFHDNSLIHWLQFKTTQALYEDKKENLILGAEMFERDNQQQLTAYLKDEFEVAQLKDSLRLWNNYKTDYAPLVDFAKVKNLDFIATNVPRRYAQIVARHGQDSLQNLPLEEKLWIVKLPYEVDVNTPGYEEMKEMMKGHAGHQIDNFIAAQAIKDATMAESILEHLKEGQLFLHYNGNFHSKEYGGIYWYLKKQQPKLKIAVISVVQTDHQKLKLPKDFSKTEFTIVVPEDMTKTY